MRSEKRTPGGRARLLFWALLWALLIPGCRFAPAGLLAAPPEPPALRTPPVLWATPPATPAVPPASPAPHGTATPVPGDTPAPSAAPTPTPASIPQTPAYTPASGDMDYYLIVDEALQVVSVMGRDGEGRYTRVVRQMPCSTGIDREPFPYGAYPIYGKSQWMLSSTQCYFRYACRFNGPFLIHSVTYERIDPHTLIRQSYLDLGRPASAGCVRLTVRDAKWIFDNCPEGTVVDYRASGGPPAAALADIPPLEDWMDFDPTDPGCANLTPPPSPPPADPEAPAQTGPPPEASAAP